MQLATVHCLGAVCSPSAASGEQRPATVQCGGAVCSHSAEPREALCSCSAGAAVFSHSGVTEGNPHKHRKNTLIQHRTLFFRGWVCPTQFGGEGCDRLREGFGYVEGRTIVQHPGRIWGVVCSHCAASGEQCASAVQGEQCASAVCSHSAEPVEAVCCHSTACGE